MTMMQCCVPGSRNHGYKNYLRQDLDRAMDMVHDGAALGEIVRATGVPKTTIRRYMKSCKEHAGACRGANMRPANMQWKLWSLSALIHGGSQRYSGRKFQEQPSTKVQGWEGEKNPASVVGSLHSCCLCEPKWPDFMCWSMERWRFACTLVRVWKSFVAGKKKGAWEWNSCMVGLQSSRK